MSQSTRNESVPTSGSSRPNGNARAGKAGEWNGEEFWDLRLYVAGQTPKSVAAINNLKRICEEHLQGRYRIQVINLMETPRLARDDQIVAIPTLVKKLPDPIRKIIGDLSDTERVLVGLQLKSGHA